MGTMTGFAKLDELRMKAASSPTGVISVSIEELNAVAVEIQTAQQSVRLTGGGLCAECGSPQWCHSVIGHDFVQPHPQIMSKYGTNVTKLITQFIAHEAIPAGGGIASAVEFFQNAERRKQVLTAAETKAIRVIELIKTAPDNPFGNDDELIAGELLKKIAERKRGLTRAKAK